MLGLNLIHVSKRNPCCLCSARRSLLSCFQVKRSAAKITSNSTVCWTACSDWQQIKHLNVASVALCGGNHHCDQWITLINGQYCEKHIMTSSWKVSISICTTAALLVRLLLHSCDILTVLLGAHLLCLDNSSLILVEILRTNVLSEKHGNLYLNHQLWQNMPQASMWSFSKHNLHAQGSTVETLYSTIYYSKYFIELNFDKSTQYVALWTHKRHPIPRPFRRAMECLLWVLQQKLTVL